MNWALFRKAMSRFLAGVVLVGLLLFLPAGSLAYWNGWLLMGLLFLPMFVAGLILFWKRPELLRSRLETKEKQREQSSVIAWSALMFLVGFLLCGFNHRFGWLVMPRWAVFAASIVFLCAYGLYAEVLRENVWLSRTVQVQEGQKVIDTGLYGIVRHPMYFATILLFLSMPLVLGSPVSFIVFLVYPLILGRRIRYEEELLEKELEGYREYQKKVKYKMIPFLW